MPLESRTAGMLVMVAFTVLTVPARAQELLYEVHGTTHDERFGGGIAILGDLDGDGIDDFVAAGISQNNLPGEEQRIRVLSGADGSLLHFFVGEVNSLTGWTIAALGDISGDGVPDYGVGDPFMDFVTVRSGVDSSELFRLSEPSTGMFGTDLASADFDGDGLGDLVIGYPGRYLPCDVDGDRDFTGRVRVLSGDDQSQLFEFMGNPSEHSYGRVVDVADVNGDGTKDILVGSPDDGRVEIYSGVDGAFIDSLSRAASSHFGEAVAGVGDVDGDGGDDFLVGAPGGCASDINGRAFLYSGKTRARLFSFRGEQSKEHFGRWVGSPGDINADGTLDLLVASLLPAQKPPLRMFSGTDGKLLYRFFPQVEALYGGLAGGMQPIGDIDGDGIGDVLLGDPTYWDFGANRAVGALYAFSGNDLFLTASAAPAPTGEPLELQIGQGVPGSLSLFVLTRIDGNPCFCPLFTIAPLDPSGCRTVTVSPDPSMAGLDLGVMAFSVGDIGFLIDTAEERVVIE